MPTTPKVKLSKETRAAERAAMKRLRAAEDATRVMEGNVRVQRNDRVLEVLATGGSRFAQTKLLASEFKISSDEAWKMIEGGLEALLRRRATLAMEIADQVERLRTVVTRAEATGQHAAAIAAERLIGDVLGTTNATRKLEITGNMSIETWADLAKIGEKQNKTKA